ncbi:MAG TPA: flagellar hook protein FlgE [Oligoflexia bacterium]|nr:flagellar hook protein FlgE [Oligoflexia bacterium]HMP47984.1 flagellar hook protein FlgE [Oligoflexia bacterium]
MRLETGMRAGRESLMAHGTALNVVADNLANVNTTGYKNNRLEFADIFAQGQGNLFGGPLQTGNGVQGTDVYAMHNLQGTVEQTGRELDAAIQGKGWFVVQDGERQYYTRAGNFTANSEGFLVTGSGKQVLGYTAESPDVPVPINVRNAVGTARPTETVALNGNLDAVSPIVNPVPGAGATFREMGEAASFTTSFQVVDSLGAERSISLFFYRTANLTWNVQAAVDGASVGGEAGVPVIVGNGQIVVDGTGRQAEGVENILQATPAWGDGAAPGNIGINLAGFTGFASPSSMSGITADGIRAGNLTGVSIDQQGNVIAIMDSGAEVPTAQLALADFQSPDGLERFGNTYFRATDASGQAKLVRPNTEGLGTIQGGALETSTVDPAREFIGLIQFQQGYRAGSQVIQTLSELISSTIQLA